MKQSAKVPRRTFLKTANAVIAAPFIVPSGVLAAQGRKGANDRVVIGHIGWGGRSRGLYRELAPLREKGAAVSVAVCDVDETRLAQGTKEIPGATPYRDYRYLLQRKDIDAVVIGTPDHWHGVQAVHAAECGKHIYVEKPACCTIEEGKAMIAAGNKYKVAIQVGSQGRSQPEAYMMHRYLANGVVGRVNHIECFHYPSPVDDKPAPDSDPPPTLDWDLWLGPLRWRPFNPKYLHGVFRWLLESGGGQIRDRGAHVMSKKGSGLDYCPSRVDYGRARLPSAYIRLRGMHAGFPDCPRPRDSSATLPLRASAAALAALPQRGMRQGWIASGGRKSALAGRRAR